jgi:FXSXX-COOH protein
MTAEPQTTRLAATLDQDRNLRLDRIPPADISRVVARIAPRERAASAPDVAAFNSAI